MKSGSNEHSIQPVQMSEWVSNGAVAICTTTTTTQTVQRDNDSQLETALHYLQSIVSRVLDIHHDRGLGQDSEELVQLLESAETFLDDIACDHVD